VHASGLGDGHLPAASATLVMVKAAEVAGIVAFDIDHAGILIGFSW
jgi:hypothetical protein